MYNRKRSHCFSRKDNKYSHFYFGKLSVIFYFLIKRLGYVLEVISLVTLGVGVLNLG